MPRVHPDIRGRVATGPAGTNGAAHPAVPSANLLKRVARSHNLTDEHLARIVKVLGRQTTLTEVGIFGVMYSEHCSYGSSRPYLKQ